MRKQRKSFDDADIRTIVSLLANTDIRITHIAERMNCSVSAITNVNSRLGVRNYHPGSRTRWTVGPEYLKNQTDRR